MDIRKTFSELYLERQQLEDTIMSLERLAELRRKRRGLQKAWIRSQQPDMPAKNELIARPTPVRVLKKSIRDSPLLHLKRAITRRRVSGTSSRH